MLLSKLDEQLRGSVLVGKNVIRAGDRMIRLGHVFYCCLILWLIFRYKGITKISKDLIVFI